MQCPNVYLSGWEFNRLLQSDPLEPRISALPASVLWSSASVFWLFERVFVTSESLAGEAESLAGLGWPSGRVFLDLENLGILQRVDLSILPDSTAQLIRENHNELIQVFDEPTLRVLIQEGDHRLLEEIKHLLLAPVFDHLECFSTALPGSVPSWFEPTEGASAVDSTSPIERVTASVRSGGIELVPSPADALTAAELDHQRELTRGFEAPLIPDLLLAVGPNEGPDGHHAHHRALSPHLDGYLAFNEVISSAWPISRKGLLALRHEAERSLWPQLHGELLPRLLLEGSPYLPEFEKRLTSAFRTRRLAGLLNLDASIVVQLLATVGAASAGLAVGVSPGQAIASMLPAGLTAGIAAGYLKRSAQSHGLRTFFQRTHR